MIGNKNSSHIVCLTARQDGNDKTKETFPQGIPECMENVLFYSEVPKGLLVVFGELRTAAVGSRVSVGTLWGDKVHDGV